MKKPKTIQNTNEHGRCVAFNAAIQHTNSYTSYADIQYGRLFANWRVLFLNFLFCCCYCCCCRCCCDSSFCICKTQHTQHNNRHVVYISTQQQWLAQALHLIFYAIFVFFFCLFVSAFYLLPCFVSFRFVSFVCIR